MNNFLDQCRNAIGPAHVLTDEKDMASYLTDWRQRFTGKALAVVKPAGADEVAARCGRSS